MAYSDDAVKAKLAALNETQDSIVTNAQWIMFHRRHADKTANLWLQRLQETNTAKRLNPIYLANEVVQQSRARGKQDFLLAFEPVIADATALAYKSASQEVQGKIKRVVEVWRQRQIFNVRIQDSIEGRMAELDKARSGGARANGSAPRLGGSLFGGGAGHVPLELEALSKSQTALAKAEAGVRPAVNMANTEYAKMTDPSTPLPTPPVHAARLSALMRNLATAQGAVEASIKARQELLAGLEKLVEANRSKLAEEETTAADLGARRGGIEDKKKEVEDGIMRGLSAPTSPTALSPPAGSPLSSAHTNGSRAEPSRPEPESFTPPPPDVEDMTPPPALDEIPDNEALAEDQTAIGEQLLSTPTSAAEPAPDLPPSFEPPPAQDPAAQAQSFLNSLGAGMVRQASSELPAAAQGNGDPRLKRRKLSHRATTGVEEDIFGSGALGGVDEEAVGAMLGL